MKHTVVDNFLPDNQLEALTALVGGNMFPWFFGGAIAHESDGSDFYFSHSFYEDHAVNSNLFKDLRPLVEKVNPKALLRVRALQYIGRDKLLEHAPHIDFSFPHQTCVFYLNTNDGFTRLTDGTCVGSLKNRALFFDGSEYHNSTNCTSDRRRMVITLNYF
jgi:hypothetical protein